MREQKQALKNLENKSTLLTKYRLAGETGSLLSCGWGIRCTFGRRCCCDYNRGNGLRGACCHVLLKLLRRNGLDANLNKLKGIK